MGLSTRAQPLVAPDLLTPPELAIAQSVLYASLFDYPLTLRQLRETLIECVLTPAQIEAVWQDSAPLQSVVAYRDGFFFPTGRAELCDERRRREARSRAFLREHQRLLTLICAMPYVRMVALSGSIAHLNLEGGGDLDLFIVTRGRRVWSVTVAVVVLAKLMRRRRLVCANFVVSDARLTLDQQDLFAASQIIHLKPLVGADVYRRFVAANPFVLRFYPNFEPDVCGPRIGSRAFAERAKDAIETLLMPFSALVEAFCFKAYRRYLMGRAGMWESPRQVRLLPDCLKLHTRSHRESILQRFDRVVRPLFR